MDTQDQYELGVLATPIETSCTPQKSFWDSVSCVMWRDKTYKLYDWLKEVMAWKLKQP